MSYILASSKPVIKPVTDYEKLKTKLRNATTGYGTAIVTSYFITQGAAEGVSATLGVASSLAYLGTLTKYVDELEILRCKRRFLYQWLRPSSSLCGITLRSVLILITELRLWGFSRINSP